MDRAEGALRVAEQSLREARNVRAELVKFSGAKPITSLYLDDDGDLVAVLADGSVRPIGNLRGPQGHNGRDGETVIGPQGPKGDTGERGTAGPTGAEGKRGEIGPRGESVAGPTGPTGIGLTGARGEGGDIGPAGLQGPIGPEGKRGADGKDGKGEIGPQGSKGDAGRDGREGSPGPKGDPGSIGPRGEAGSQGPRGEAGREGPPGQAGATGARGEPGQKGDAGPQGQQGPQGHLPTVKAYEEGTVYYCGDCVVADGSLYQALRDTGRGVTHSDWVCLARAGRDGSDGRSPNVCGTYSVDEIYERLDIVAMDGAAFIARCDNPGLCPGENWQLLSRQGRPGRKGEIGERGMPGPQGPKGDAGADAPQIVSFKLDRPNYRFTSFLSNGAIGPELNFREAFEQFLADVGGQPWTTG